jgi:CMP-N-acetylneuraminic acid synthetase
MYIWSVENVKIGILTIQGGIHMRETKIGLIGARKGSERVPNKNLRLLKGKPLLWYTLKAAEDSSLELYYLSTDYPVYTLLEAGINLNDFKKLTIIQRPLELCTSEATSVSFIEHAIMFMNVEKITPESICLLQPTCPLRSSGDIDNALFIYGKGNHSGLVSVYEVPKGQLYENVSENYDTILGSTIYGTKFRRNEVVYVRNSSVYIFDVSYFLREKSIFPRETHIYVMPQHRSIDINYEIDMEICEKLL